MKTVRVRIAVAVNERGEWSSGGQAWIRQKVSVIRMPDSEAVESALYDLAYDESQEGMSIHFIEADIPVPAPTTIEGTVTPQQGTSGNTEEGGQPAKCSRKGATGDLPRLP